MKYEKRVKITDTGMVVAEVYAADGRRVGLRFFSSMFPSTKRTEANAKKAHAWADGHISMCARQET